MALSANGVTIECIQGDITRQDDVDAVVNAANAELISGGGVAGAIHRAAGSSLAEECKPLAPIKPGEAVITGAHNMPNQHIIHVLGPVYGVDEPAATLLASCYREALDLAESKGLRSIAFPAISTGAFGYPMDHAADVASRTVLAKSAELESVELIRWVLFSEEDREVHQRIFDLMFNA